MSKSNVILAILGILLVLTTGFAAVFAFKTSDAVSDLKWEYWVGSVPDSSLLPDIDKMGANGWEMILARRASDGDTVHPKMSYEMIFKRRPQSAAPGNDKMPNLLPK